MGRAAIALAFGVLAGAAACVSLQGLSGEAEPALPDGGATDAAPAPDALPPDPCRHAFPPAEPATDDDPVGEVPPFVLAVKEASVKGTIDAGAPIGYDLDDVCSCFPERATAHAGEPSCVVPEGGGAACDSDGGVDNALGGLLAAYPDFLGTTSNSGGPTLLVKIAKYNGRANDREVFVTVVASPGIYDPSGCAKPAGDAGPGPFEPTWKGCDRWTVDPDYVLPGTTEPSSFVSAYVVDHVLVMRPTTKPTIFMVAGTAFPLTGTRVSAHLVAVDEQLRPLVPQPEVGTRFAIDEGVLSGRAATSDLLRTLAGSLAQKDGGPLCGTPAFYDAVKTKFVCPGADVVRAPTTDFAAVTCDAVSVASAFAALPAVFGEQRPLDPTPCGDPRDPRFAGLFECP